MRKDRTHIILLSICLTICLLFMTSSSPSARAVEEIYDDFEDASYMKWTPQGDAFRNRPSRSGEPGFPAEMTGHEGQGVASSHTGGAELAKGKLLSKPFAIDHDFIIFRICGGKHPGATSMRLRVDGKTVRLATGDDSNILKTIVWDAAEFRGKQAYFEIIDNAQDDWGYTIVDRIVFADSLPTAAEGKIEEIPTQEPALAERTRQDLCRYSSGVPLGGIGAGSVEIRADGSLREWQIFNNWGNGLSLDLHRRHPEYNLLNAFLAARIDGRAYVLETDPPAGLPGVKSVAFDAQFPFANLRYEFPGESPVELSLEAFSPFIPRQASNSGLPVFGLTFTARNTSKAKKRVTLAISAVNPLGVTCQNRPKTSGTLTLDIVSSTDGRVGLALASLDATPSAILGGQDNDESLTKGFWRKFDAGSVGKGQEDGKGQRLALMVDLDLKPGETRQARFLAAWFFPEHSENGWGPVVGHQYEKWGDSPIDMAIIFAEKFDSLRRRSADWRDTMLDADWPAWVTDWALNSQGRLVKDSWWTREGLWGVYDSENRPSLSPLSEMELAGWPTLDLFPELELGLLKQYAERQHDNGQMPEEMRRSSREMKRVTFGSMSPSLRHAEGRDLIELGPLFAIEVQHRYIETGDELFLSDCYPHVKRAMQYAKREFDSDQDSLPDLVGSGRTNWGNMNLGYSSSYTAAIWLAAVKATIKMALSQKDTLFETEMRLDLKNGQDAMREKFWNGNYFALAVDKEGKKRLDHCFIDQIYGDILARLTGVGSIFPQEDQALTLSALLSIERLNARRSPAGTLSLVDGQGAAVALDDPRLCIAPAKSIAPAIGLILHGEREKGLGALKRLHDRFAASGQGPWNAPDSLAADGQPSEQALESPLRNSAIWALIKALNGWNYDGVSKMLTVRTPGGEKPMPGRGPWITPQAYGTLDQKVDPAWWKLNLLARSGKLELRKFRLEADISDKAKIVVTYNGQVLKYARAQTSAMTGDMTVLTFLKPVILKADTALDLQVFY